MPHVTSTSRMHLYNPHTTNNTQPTPINKYTNYHYTTTLTHTHTPTPSPHSLKTDPNTPPIIPLTRLGSSRKHVITTAVLTANTAVSRHCLCSG